jgi:hypothetical protein
MPLIANALSTAPNNSGCGLSTRLENEDIATGENEATQGPARGPEWPRAVSYTAARTGSVGAASPRHWSCVTASATSRRRRHGSTRRAHRGGELAEPQVGVGQRSGTALSGSAARGSRTLDAGLRARRPSRTALSRTRDSTLKACRIGLGRTSGRSGPPGCLAPPSRSPLRPAGRRHEEPHVTVRVSARQAVCRCGPRR